jgi:hypothetical protein
MTNALRLLPWSRATTSARNMYPGHPVFLTATIVVPFVGPTMAGAVSGRSAEATTHLTLAAYATRACGPITFEWNTDVPVTYFQIHATGVSCAVAKTVVVKGGKYDGAAPKGWTFAGTTSRGSDGDSTWKHGAARVTGYMVNSQGC